MNDWERTFIQEYWVVTYLENYSADSGRHSHPVKGALLETMLPSLHYLVIVATLDEALAEYVEINNVPWPNKTKRDLLNRIKVVSGVVSGIDAVVLQEIRERRNVIAHEPDSILSRPVTWEELDGAIGCVSVSP